MKKLLKELEMNNLNISWIDDNTPEKILQIVKKFYSNDIENMFNFILTVKFFKNELNFNCLNENEEMLYKTIDDMNEIKRKLLILKNFQKCCESFINEYIK
jgi:hypothetical protein